MVLTKRMFIFNYGNRDKTAVKFLEFFAFGADINMGVHINRGMLACNTLVYR